MSQGPHLCCRFMEFFGSLVEKQRAGHVDLAPGAGVVVAHRSLYLIPASKDVAQLLQVSPVAVSLPACLPA